MEKDINPLRALRNSANDVLIQDAKKGDIHAARSLLTQIVTLLEAGIPLPENLAAWLAVPLSKVLEAPKENKAFGLTKRAGRPPTYNREFQRLVADFHHQTPGGKKSKGMNSDDADRDGEAIKTAKEFGISPNKVIEYYERHIDDILEEHRIQDELRRENEEE